MTAQIQMILLLLALLQIKHMVADFFLQTPRMLSARGRYLHLGRLHHAALHGGLSLVTLVLVGVPVDFSLIVCAVETVVHFHIDWAKGRLSETSDSGPQDAGYWRAFGIDQLMHQLTYVAMLWAVAAAIVD